MKKYYSFDSRYTIGAELPKLGSIKDEPMLFSADLAFARQHGGPATSGFLDALPWDWRVAPDLIIDSRVHMVMRGWFTAVPGFHTDDTPRSAETGQPDYDNPAYHAEHVMALYNGEISPTEFAVGTIQLPEVDPSLGPVYGQWHPLVEAAIDAGTLRRESVPSNRLIFFDCHAFHQGVPAIRAGWRFFIRATRNTHRKRFNEIRRQVQVYLPVPMEGW